MAQEKGVPMVGYIIDWVYSERMGERETCIDWGGNYYHSEI